VDVPIFIANQLAAQNVINNALNPPTSEWAIVATALIYAVGIVGLIGYMVWVWWRGIW
jgi:preprotein translocase subunit Sss1